MSTKITMARKTVEALMLEKYKTEPFHNLYLLYGIKPPSLSFGGTCSDKTLSFLAALKQAGFDAFLHSGFIDGKEIHRLVRVSLDKKIFFADIGNGWPALRLYPLDQEVLFHFFGMEFRTKIEGKYITIFHKRNGKEFRQLEIDTHGKSEIEIQADIDARFDSGIVYPFSKSLRFSLVVENRFLFLRGERLEIYSDDGCEVVVGFEENQVPSLIMEYFRYDIASLLPEFYNLRRLRQF